MEGGGGGGGRAKGRPQMRAAGVEGVVYRDGGMGAAGGGGVGGEAKSHARREQQRSGEGSSPVVGGGGGWAIRSVTPDLERRKGEESKEVHVFGGRESARARLCARDVMYIHTLSSIYTVEVSITTSRDL